MFLCLRSEFTFSPPKISLKGRCLGFIITAVEHKPMHAHLGLVDRDGKKSIDTHLYETALLLANSTNTYSI